MASIGKVVGSSVAFFVVEISFLGCLVRNQACVVVDIVKKAFVDSFSLQLHKSVSSIQGIPLLSFIKILPDFSFSYSSPRQMRIAV